MSKKYLPVYHSCTLGCDPELFVSAPVGRAGRQYVIGSDVVLGPAKKLTSGVYGEVVCDGAQLELHPMRSACRETLSRNITTLFKALAAHITLTDPTLQIDMRPVIQLTKGNLDRLSDPAKQLGCMPSRNAYGRPHIQKDGAKYAIRSASGHIHLGFNKGTVDDFDRLAKVMDIMVGTVGVLIDRDPSAALRRKVYGRAGEYRTPQHGFEYRTLSNFWLRNYKLASLMFAQARTAYHMYATQCFKDETTRRATFGYNLTQYHFTVLDELLKKADFQKIEQAINTNDYDLARSNFEDTIVELDKTLNKTSHGVLFNLKAFIRFTDKIRKAELAGNPDPLSVWFKEDAVSHWCKGPVRINAGWESYCSKIMATKSVSAIINVPTAVVPSIDPIPTPSNLGITESYRETSINGGVWTSQ